MKEWIILVLIITLITNFQSSIGQTTDQQLKIISASDFGCSPLAHDNIKKIMEKNPDLFLVPGDLGYDKDGACWFKEVGVLDGITKIAIGQS